MSGLFRIISSGSGLAGKIRPAHSFPGLLLLIIYLLFIHRALLPLQGSCVVGLNFIIAQSQIALLLLLCTLALPVIVAVGSRLADVQCCGFSRHRAVLSSSSVLPSMNPKDLLRRANLTFSSPTFKKADTLVC
ncbi:hypothetical protein ASPFODRAFT_346680 [Aspergillus luchuensis CBS 106.47]|uniref:Uncharacterized protein n=1 Tax=Aspergillus luchuensis (strain CBS 106.47) TaxID=1137211 RepID=A0A1M3T605_ASPLC|nr:hypothetical protein ASPFODRAFT_346680 [Aspergillus luchuensis CBS 106.47]